MVWLMNIQVCCCLFSEEIGLETKMFYVSLVKAPFFDSQMIQNGHILGLQGVISSVLLILKSNISVETKLLKLPNFFFKKRGWAWGCVKNNSFPIQYNTCPEFTQLQSDYPSGPLHEGGFRASYIKWCKLSLHRCIRGIRFFFSLHPHSSSMEDLLCLIRHVTPPPHSQ